MEEHGRVICIMQQRSGVSQRTGQPWASLDFVIETEGRYPRKVRLSLWGQDNIYAAGLQPGEYITCKFEIEAHEVNGEFYNDLRCWDILKQGSSLLRRQQTQPQAAPQQQQVNQPQQMPQQQVNNAPNNYTQQAAPKPYAQPQDAHDRIYGQMYH